MEKTLNTEKTHAVAKVIFICLCIFALVLFGLATYQMVAHGDPDPFRNSLKILYHYYGWVIVGVMVSIMGGLMYVLISKTKPV